MTKRVSASKRQLQAAGKEAEAVAVVQAEVGLAQAAEGVEKLQAAQVAGSISQVALAAGSRDLTRAEDALNVSGALEQIAGIAAVAGSQDLADGAAALAASEDVAVQSLVVDTLAIGDLKHGMRLAGIAGQLRMAGDLLEVLGRPIFALFMAEKADELNEIALNAILVAGATRALAQSLEETSATLEDAGADQVAQGTTRLKMAGQAERLSEDLADAGADLVTKGIAEVEVAGVAHEVAQELAVEGVAEIAAGAEAVGSAEALATVGEALEEAGE
jgi:hypothetical protein